MKILIINFAAKSKGALSVIEEFYNVIQNDNKDIKWEFLVSDNYFESSGNINIIVDKTLNSRFKRLMFDLFYGHYYIKRYNPDIVVSFQNTLPLFLDCKKVIYLHQSIPFQNEKKYSFFKKKERSYAVIQYLIGFIIKKSIKRANLTIVQSNWLKNAISRYSKNTKMISPTINQIKHDYITFNDKVNNFFYPTSDYPYKNNEVIAKAVSLLETHNQDFHVKLTVNKHFSSDKIHSIGQVSREQVISLLSKSVLIFPSYIESFGLPLLEARELNRIILTSNTAFAHEILDDYPNAYYFEKDDYIELAELMNKVLQGEITIKPFENKSKLNNSWEQVRDSIIGVIK